MLYLRMWKDMEEAVQNSSFQFALKVHHQKHRPLMVQMATKYSGSCESQWGAVGGQTSVNQETCSLVQCSAHDV